MSKEYASLIAQVVPVLALALGLEVRAILGRMRDQITAEAGETNHLARISALFGSSGTVMAALAAYEIKALHIVSGLSAAQYWEKIVLQLAVIAVFMLPLASFYSALAATGASRKAYRSATAVTFGVITLLGVLIYTAI